MNALIIGAGGFVGKYLIEDLNKKGYNVSATKLSFETLSVENCTVFNLDISDAKKIKEVLINLKPDVIFNLAAVSSVSLSWKYIKKTFDVNVCGTINLLNCVKEYNKNIRVLLIGSSEEYGFTKESEMPVSEACPVNPSNPYAVSKLSQTYMGEIYADAFDMDVIMMRAFNHIGPGQPLDFVVPDFCCQIAAIMRGEQNPVILTGNLNVKRDFTDVRDITSGYILCAQKGLRGQIYNIGSGHAVSIGWILEQLISFSSAEITITPDPLKFRPIDVPVIEADIQKIHAETGWSPKISNQQSLADTLEYWKINI